ncbi:hypothetical protein [Arthrobacter sp. B0490]|uniref:hypothetical protein n=1 Tax=Arthrobacter sp. B0490 TaxID=2058891 RepID=UPI000CE4ED98|nr:hypothetical protein [Arthrobacter sp. B0490]
MNPSLLPAGAASSTRRGSAQQSEGQGAHRVEDGGAENQDPVVQPTDEDRRQQGGEEPCGQGVVRAEPGSARRPS